MPLKRRSDSERDDGNQMAGADCQAIRDIRGRFSKDDEIGLARQVEALVVRVLS